MTRRTFVIGILLAVLCGGVLRTLWLRSDPPVGSAEVGIVWHDEGAWTHNARNKVLWGIWRTDNWNPVFVTPVFTELEYVAFRTFGVGTWQARTVPVASGLAAVVFLIAGLRSASGRRAAMIGAWLIATNYVFVMWNRAALMESTMTSFIVVGWAAYAMAARRPAAWGVIAGAAVVLAWFTKASAAFFVAAIVLDCLVTLALTFARRRAKRASTDGADDWRAALCTLGGMGIVAIAVMAFFVLPHAAEYRFYNWQMSVTRKPSYGIRHLIDRASWLPIVQSFFTRMWLVVTASAVAIAGIIARWRTARPGERLLVLWVVLSLAELVVHDAGNERYYVMLIPALIALAAMLIGSDAPVFPQLTRASSLTRSLGAVLLLALGYLVFGSVVRLAFLDAIAAGRFYGATYVSAGAAVAFTLLVISRWQAVARWLSATRVPALAAAAFVCVSVGFSLLEYAQWARVRSNANYRASVEIGRLLPAGTLVHGKLANGLDLDNQIRPIFVGDHFGNYDDRLSRDDVRYILTYTSPREGYESGAEGRVILDVLNHYPDRRIIASFDVDETGGADRAALIDKFPSGGPHR